MSKTHQLIQYIRIDDEVIELQSPPTRAVQNMSGWGYPRVNTQEISGPYQHGTSILGYRYQSRTITLDLIFSGSSKDEVWGERTKLIGRMGLQSTSPNYTQLGKLRWEYIQNGANVRRDVNCYLSRGLVYSPSPQWYGGNLVESLEFIAADPIIYDPTLVTVTIDTFTDHLVLPMEFPFILGTGEGTSNIAYTGSWIAYPTIEVDGPTRGFRIINNSTGQTIILDYFIMPGITVTFDLTPNYRSVTDSLGNDLASYLRNSSLAEFGIEIDPFATNGINDVSVYVMEYTAATEVRIKYYTRYIGI